MNEKYFHKTSPEKKDFSSTVWMFMPTDQSIMHTLICDNLEKRLNDTE